MLKGVGPASLRLIADSPSFTREGTVRRVPRLSRIPGPQGAWDEAATRQQDRAESTGTPVLAFGSPDFPALLAKSKDSPFFLWVRGDLPSTPDIAVAVIGTRKPTPHGTLIAERMREYFARARWSVIGGLAFGCDATAHRATLRAGGHTIAVLAHGLQTVAPASHKALAEETVEAGDALVSEFGFGIDALPAQFIRRNKTQAGLAHGVIMIQSDIKGESPHAARAVISYGRWLAMPVPTSRDLATNDPKIQANLVLTSSDDEARRSLLHCGDKDLRFVRPIQGKEDYDTLIDVFSLHG